MPPPTTKTLDENLEELRISLDSKLDEKLQPLQAQLDLLVAGLQGGTSQARRGAHEADDTSGTDRRCLASKDRPGRESFHKGTNIASLPGDSSRPLPTVDSSRPLPVDECSA